MGGLLSVIIPACNEAETVAAAAHSVSEVLSRARIPHELIFVDDGSGDDTWRRIVRAAEADSRIRGISFSRNFGKEAAIFAGMRAAAGDCIVTIDCDLQHPPEKIPEMYALWTQGYEIVEGRKSSRGRENAAHRLCTKIFNKLMSLAVGFDLDNASDYKLLDRKAVDALLSMPEKNVFYRALSKWVGFKTAAVCFDVNARSAGTSKWPACKLVCYAFKNISSFTGMPLQLVTGLGVLMLVFALVLGIQTLANKFTGTALDGFTTCIMVMLFIGSLTMISLGLIGYYLMRLYEEVKGRPRYIVSRTTEEGHG